MHERDNINNVCLFIEITVSSIFFSGALLMPSELTTSHSLRRGSASYANVSPWLSIQWISTRGDWLLDSLTKTLAYVGTTTHEDQSVDKVLAGYKDPHLPCVTPSVSTLKELLSGFEYTQVLSLRAQLFKT